MSKKQAIRIHADDLVAVALEPLEAGQTIDIEGTSIKLLENIPQGHKFALKPIAKNQSVIKYGYPIGAALQDIKAGEHVHTHNIHTLLENTKDYTYDEIGAKTAIEAWQKANREMPPIIKAYKRPDGKIGIRNEIWIIPTVGCVNKIAQTLSSYANEKFCGGKPAPNVTGGLEGVFAWEHPYGCSQMGVDKETTAKILCDLAKHPNAGAVLILSLGCEENNLDYFRQYLGDYDENRIKFMVAQEYEDEIAKGKEILDRLAEYVSSFRREEVGMDNIVLGMKCGGSDGLSGITANALVGRICDTVTGFGGSVMLTEVPEMFGAEQVLMNRCLDRECFTKTVKLINNFKQYYAKHNQVCYENPSPGNKAGGITTLEDKSLGCVQKGGKAPVCGVLKYGEILSQKGLNLLEGPGNDIVSTTAQTASGANMILFTTGRGNPMGAPVPTVKIATNHTLAKTKAKWLDFDAEDLLDKDTNTVKDSLLSLICRIASGEVQTKNEINGYREIAIFKDGVTL